MLARSRRSFAASQSDVKNRIDLRSRIDHQECVTSLEQIAARLDELEKRVATAERERDEYRALYIQMMERCRKLERGLLASKSEHLPENGAQLSLDVLTGRDTSG